MKCPFLKETRVKFCQVSPIKKMIVSDRGDTEIDKCSTPSWADCPLARQRTKDTQEKANCPFLQESYVQYCSLSSVTKFIPYSEAPFSRCLNDGHKYCEHYLALSSPENATQHTNNGNSEDDACENPAWDFSVEGIRMPARLSYTPNHMWIDVNDDGLCHIGVDAFFTGVFGTVDAVSFVTTKGVTRPTAVLTVNGIDVEVIFPNELLLIGLNSYLRAAPDRLSNDPYGTGWLFEGQRHKSAVSDTELLNGERARKWMKIETERLSKFVHEELNTHQLDGKKLMADGGSFAPSLASQLNRDKILKVIHEFFSPYATWRM
jgi:glycine cleavage system H lipoate-binding protein